MNKYNIFFSMMWIMGIACGFSLAAIECDFLLTQNNVDAGVTMDQPGVWCLSEDVTFSSASAIVITATGVVFDLDGHTIDGGSNGQVGIVVSNVSQTSIQNGTIKNTLDDAIQLSGSHDVMVDRITINNAGGSGVSISATSSDVLLQDCRVDGTGNVGIAAEGTGLFHAVRCQVINCDSGGFSVQSDHFSLYLCSVVQSIGVEPGFNLVGDNGSMRLCFAQAGGADGVKLSGDNVTIENSRIIDNGGTGIVIDMSVGTVHISSNTVTGNDGYGIHSHCGITGDIIRNDVSGNTLGDLFHVCTI